MTGEGLTYYKSCLRWHISLEMSPYTLHDIGVQTVDTIITRLLTVSKRLPTCLYIIYRPIYIYYDYSVTATSGRPTLLTLFPSKLAIKGFFECPGDVTFLFKLFLWPFYFFFVNPDAP